MGARQPRYTKEESARGGQEIYETRVRSLVEDGNSGRIVAIDIDSGEFEVADDTVVASDRLLTRCPDAQTWFVGILHRAVHRFGQSLHDSRIAKLVQVRQTGARKRG